VVVRTRSTELRLAAHVHRLGEEHPPIELDSVDWTVLDPVALSARFGHVLDYMARVELEVDRNVLELVTMLPDPPEVDRHFYADVWHLDTVSAKPRVLAVLGHLDRVQDVSRRAPAGPSRRGRRRSAPPSRTAA
jgi:ParB-like chromosome segregation protein Spo0J